jgi:hypothetical protein
MGMHRSATRRTRLHQKARSMKSAEPKKRCTGRRWQRWIVRSVEREAAARAQVNGDGATLH